MGFAAAFWFCDSLLEVAKLSKNAFRSFREGNKVYVIQKQRNDRGNFVIVTVLGDSKERGGVIIPEGRESWGWHGISEELKGLLSATAMENHRRPLADKSTTIGNFRKDHAHSKPLLFMEGISQKSCLLILELIKIRKRLTLHVR